jgi:hypothetical protein
VGFDYCVEAFVSIQENVGDLKASTLDPFGITLAGRIRRRRHDWSPGIGFILCLSRRTPATDSATNPIAAVATCVAKTVEMQSATTTVFPAPALRRATAAAIATTNHAAVATIQRLKRSRRGDCP